MVDIPLILELKKTRYKNIAIAQDLIIGAQEETIILIPVKEVI